MGAINFKGKLIYIFEKDINIEVYLNILSEMVPEMRQINNHKLGCRKIMLRSISH